MTRTFALLTLVACSGGTLDIAPPGDYSLWKRVDTWGHAPGHGDSYRIIYANELATQFDVDQRPHEYPDGSIVIKEVYDNRNNSPGALRVIEIARRVGPASGEQAGWLFSATGEPNGAETEETFCWRRCHVAAPLAGMWFNYGR